MPMLPHDKVPEKRVLSQLEMSKDLKFTFEEQNTINQARDSWNAINNLAGSAGMIDMAEMIANKDSDIIDSAKEICIKKGLDFEKLMREELVDYTKSL